MVKLLALLVVLAVPAIARAADLPVVDAHIHYSHDAWSVGAAEGGRGAPAGRPA